MRPRFISAGAQIKNMKKGLILINAYSRLPSAINQSGRLKDELKRLGVETDIRRNDFFPLSVGSDGGIKGDLSGYDFCVYLDKDKYVAAMIEMKGLRLFNSRTTIEICDDKMRTHIALADCGIPMPTTIPGLLCYDPDEKVREEAFERLEKELGYPMIVKACYGSLGKDVYKADDRAQLAYVAEKLKCRPHLFQKFISESAGRDLRVIVIGGKVAAAMERASENDFRSNLELGGKGTTYAPDGELKELCGRVADRLGLDYCGIDVLEGRDGPIICEVNSNAFFGGIEKVTGVNVAELYARHIYGEIYG